MLSEEEERPAGAAEPEAEAGAEAPGAQPEPKSEKEYESLYLRIQKMSVAERISLGLKGDKEARGLLIKDANKLVQLAVISSPRLQDAEVVAIAKNRSVNEEVLRRIAARKEWLKHYEVRLGLIQNPRTPLPVAMKLVGTLSARDLQNLAKSKNVPTAIASLARKAVQTKKT
jgi:hypothetical protein